MIVVRLIGGLGNQMFQYALGRKLSLMHNVPLKLDLSLFSSYTLRKYALDSFNISADIATKEDLSQINCYGNVIKELDNRFDNKVFQAKLPLLLDGYWQSELYFNDVKDVLLNDFILKKEIPSCYDSIIEKIYTTNSVAVHIRRGDYIYNNETNQYHGVCSERYYLESIRFISESIDSINLLVFSDDYKWVVSNFKPNYPTTYVTHINSNADAIDLWLISKCKHQITANSSFSWWGAWLNNNPAKTVCVPLKWFASATRNTTDLIPDGWHRINDFSFEDNSTIRFLDTKNDLYEMPKISVIMSVYNAKNSVSMAVESILKQSFQMFEFIIIDDASTDGSLDVLKSFDDPRIRIIENIENLGLTKSLNIGIKLARGEYIARMDADDFSVPHRFETQLALLDNYESLAVVGSAYYQMNDLGDVGSIVDVITEPDDIHRQLIHQNWFGHGTLMMRKSCLVAVGGYDDNFLYAQDYDLLLRLSERFKLANIGEPLYFWRMASTGISQQKAQEQKFFALLARKQALLRRVSQVSQANSPLVSVIVPTYNRPEMLGSAIQSILEQTMQDFEIIVVNDAGQDAGNLVSSFNSPKITYLSHEKNKGLAAARNTGIKAAHGKYIAYLDDDDIYYPQHLEVLSSYLENHDCKVVYADSYRATQQLIEGTYCTVARECLYSLDFDYDRILWQNFVPVLCFMHEKACLEQTGLFDENLKRHEDWDLWIRMSRNFQIDHIPSVTSEYTHREDGTGMVSGTVPMFLRSFDAVTSKYRDMTSNRPEIQDSVKSSRFIMIYIMFEFLGRKLASLRDSGKLPETINGLVDLLEGTGGTKDEIFSAFFQEAARMEQFPSPKKALQCLEHALSFCDYNVFARSKLSELLLGTGAHEAAISHMEILFQSNPVEPKLLTALSKLYMAQGNKEKARFFVDQLLAVEPDNQEGRDLLVTLLPQRNT